MQVPLEISYHNIDKSETAEDAIRSHVADLEEIYDRITSCRVRVDQRAKNESRSIPPVVRIELRIPGHKNIVVAHEPDHLLRKYQSPDLYNAINEAFRIAEERLQELKEMREPSTRATAAAGEVQFLGQVAEIYPLQDYGYLMNKDGALLYFHRNSILAGNFDYLVRGAEAYYVEENGDTGPLAKKVWVKETGHKAA
ncbi:MAG: HPF/RaiA family ribosome-associated protein [Xanthobacteraceae bacterium]|nr:HPF/RaiA family ribosome-associated protein [Xanthobacteraceae bacterium]